MVVFACTHTYSHTRASSSHTHTHTYTHTHTHTGCIQTTRSHSVQTGTLVLHLRYNFMLYALTQSSVPRHHKSCRAFVLAGGKTESFSVGSWVCRPAVCISRTAGFVQTLTVAFNQTPVTKYWNRPDHRLSGLCPKDAFSASFRRCLDVGRRVRDKLRPMREHGSVLLCVHGNHKAR